MGFWVLPTIVGGKLKPIIYVSYAELPADKDLNFVVDEL
jgi:hypothetical protein